MTEPLLSPELVTDMLIFHDVPEVGEHMAKWRGPWPPPPVMVVVMQGAPNYRRVGTVTEVEYITPEWMTQMVGTTLAPLYFELRNASAMPDPAPPDAHWFRGAEYFPAEVG